jgi:biopolymer transport protein ExbB/TolQ
VTGFINAFSNLREAGAADPAELAGDISVALLTGLWGAIFSLVFLIPFIIAIIKYRRFRRLISTTVSIQTKEAEQGGDGDAE